MTEDSALISPEAVEARRRELAVLKAVGLEKLPPEQRELVLVIARKWDLSLELKHLVMIEGRPYITRDGLLWIAHRSGQLDGIEVTEPSIVTLPGVGEFWRAVCRVWRKDMSRPFEYAGRYPTRSGNVKYGPEMAVKTAESHALRRAFNVAVATVDEQWDLPTVQADVDAVSTAQHPPRTLSERVQERRQATSAGEVTYTATPPPIEAPRPSTAVPTADPLEAADLAANAAALRRLAVPPITADEDDEETQSLGVARLEDARRARANAEPTEVVDLGPNATRDAAELVCGDEDDSPLAIGFCELPPGHKSAHKNEQGSWPLLRM